MQPSMSLRGRSQQVSANTLILFQPNATAFVHTTAITEQQTRSTGTSTHRRRITEASGFRSVSAAAQRRVCAQARHIFGAELGTGSENQQWRRSDELGWVSLVQSVLRVLRCTTNGVNNLHQINYIQVT